MVSVSIEIIYLKIYKRIKSYGSNAYPEIKDDDINYNCSGLLEFTAFVDALSLLLGEN